MVVLRPHPRGVGRASPSRSAPSRLVDARPRRPGRRRDGRGRAAGGRTAARRRAATPRARRRAPRRRSRRGCAAGRRRSTRARSTVRPHLPALADRQHLVEVAGLDDGEHPLLALARHAPRTAPCPARGAARAATSTSMPTPPRAAVSLVAQREAGAAEVLDADDEAGVEQREAGLDQALLLERIADLHGRAAWPSLALVEAGRGEHAHAADAVAPGRRAEQHGQVADARGPAEHEPVDRAARRGTARSRAGCPRRSSSNTTSPPTVGTPTELP